MFTALLVILILVVLIVVHELGHFVTAKIFGVRVDEFGIGYPPRAFLVGTWGGTQYTLNWIPFGGFVRLFGEESDGHGTGSFVDMSRGKQALILIAGVTMNVVAAWALFVGAYSTGILHIVDDSNAPGAQLMVTDIVPSSPMDAAGVKPGDIVRGMSNEAGAHAVLTPDGILEFVSAHGGKELTVTYEHLGIEVATTVVPAHAVIADEAGRPAVGVGLALVTTEALTLPDAMRAASISTYNTGRLVTQGLGKIIGGALLGAPDLKGVTGPIGLVSVVGEASRSGIGYILSLAAFISVNLAIINLIPIPALDGGRLVLVGLEALLRRPAPKLAVQVLNTLGVALIIILMITVTYNDIARLLL